MESIRFASIEKCTFIGLDESLLVTSSLDISSDHLSHITLDIRSTLLSILDPFTTSLVLIHNHPSGRIYPSKTDYETTFKLVTLGELLHFKVHDHIIVTKEDYFSFAEAGILETFKSQFS